MEKRGKGGKRNECHIFAKGDCSRQRGEFKSALHGWGMEVCCSWWFRRAGKKRRRGKNQALSPPSSHFSGGSQHGTKRREREGIVDGKINKGNRAVGGDDLASWKISVGRTTAMLNQKKYKVYGRRYFLHFLVFLPGINNPNPFLCSLPFSLSFPKTEEPGIISNLLSLLRESTDFLQLPEPFSGVSSLTQLSLDYLTFTNRLSLMAACAHHYF